jgi:hypothetical protein
VLSWTPLNDNVGTSTIIVKADDGKSGIAYDTMLVIVHNVNDVPEFLTTALHDSAWEDSGFTGQLLVSDVDIGDSLRVVLSSPGTWLSASLKRDTGAIQWLLTLAGTPRDENTGMNQISLTITDKANAAVVVRDSIFVVNTNDAPQTSIALKKVIGGAVEYTVAGKDDVDSIFTFSASFTRAGESVTIAAKSSISGVIQYYPLSDGTYIFKCAAKDDQGFADSTPVCDTLIVSGATTQSFAYADSVWHMMSVPARPIATDSLKSNGYFLYWNESVDEDPLYKFYQQADAITSTKSGAAYWRKSPSSATISLAPDQLLDSTVELNLMRKRFGWNQISSPFVYPVKCPGTEVLWKWNPQTNDYEEQTDRILYPWQGYWILTETVKNIAISSLPVFTYTGVAKRLERSFVDKGEWKIQMVLTASGSQDADNFFGLSKGAKNTWDDLDRPEPPRMADLPYVFFTHPEWKSGVSEYASDIRERWQDGMVFRIGISAAQSASVLSFAGVDAFSGMYLFYADKDTSFAITSASSIPIVGSGTEAVYKAVFASQDPNFITRLPVRFTVGTPYPNPFHPNVNIRYTLPLRWLENGMFQDEPYAVSIKMYDMQGRVVRTLVNRPQGPGQYHVVWDGKSNTGRITSAGTFIMRVEAGKFSSVRKMVMVK